MIILLWLLRSKFMENSKHLPKKITSKELKEEYLVKKKDFSMSYQLLTF